MSVASAGVKLAEKIFGKLGERTRAGFRSGNYQRASDRATARPWHCATGGDEPIAGTGGSPGRGVSRHNVVPWGEWDTALQTPDVIVSSVAAEEPVLEREVLERAMAARGNRALLLMDLGLPRNIDPAAASFTTCISITWMIWAESCSKAAPCGRAKSRARKRSWTSTLEISFLAGQRRAGRAGG